MPAKQEIVGGVEEPPLRSGFSRGLRAALCFILRNWSWNRSLNGFLPEGDSWEVPIPGVYPLPNYYPDFILRSK